MLFDPEQAISAYELAGFLVDALQVARASIDEKVFSCETTTLVYLRVPASILFYETCHKLQCRLLEPAVYETLYRFVKHSGHHLFIIGTCGPLECTLFNSSDVRLCFSLL